MRWLLTTRNRYSITGISRAQGVTLLSFLTCCCGFFGGGFIGV